jgi:predicted metal-dependent enzyme (double-stranded beta helix superfamily)
MDISELIDACREVAGGDTPTRDVSELVGAFLDQPNLPSLLGDGDRSTYEALYRGEDILVLHGVVPPTPAPVAPHDHRMWAVIGVYQGLEHNQLFVRAEGGGLESVDRFTVAAGEVRTLDPSTIHSVQAGGDRYLGAIHVYGGDLFGTPRSTWVGDVECPMDESALPAFFERLRGHETELGRAMTPDEVATFLAGPSAPGAGSHS